MAGPPSSRLVRGLTVRLFGATALVAVVSVWWQLAGLFGAQGVAPIADTLRQVRAAPDVGFWDLPTAFWLSADDWALHGALAIAALASLALIAGLFPRAAAWVLWAAWLSVVAVGQPFLSFQWDVLLLEGAFFLGFYAGPDRWLHRATREPAPAAAFAMTWLAFKVTFASGLVKWFSGDPSWRDLSALTYHWWTQPLPTWTSVVLNELPRWLQQVLCGVTLLIELPLALLALGPRPARRVAGVAFVALQAGLFGAGNYSYYNVLTGVLALPLLDDGLLRRRAPPSPPSAPAPRTFGFWLGWAGAGLAVALGVSGMARRLGARTPLAPLEEALAPFDTINGYGAFAVMTKDRPEIVLEGSGDGAVWTRYDFPYKADAPEDAPRWVAPWQPRLDWQMWFASLSSCQANPWLLSLQRHLLLGTPAVRALFAGGPVGPQRFVRATVWDYRFAPLGAKGVWWVARDPRPYCPTLALTPEGELTRAEP